MHTISLLEQAILVARHAGYEIRHEWLDGSTGGACELAGKKLLFVDLAATAADQLEQVGEALREDTGVSRDLLSPELASYLGLRRSA